ncbi:MAG: hypothetical protein MJE12_06545 [Alphaproteobacteria bacterium]|nr:hypothetical protein [Alphaproteobacteria bacterium]
MALLIFPAAVGFLTIAIWVAVALVDTCLLGHTDAKFSCWSGLEIVALFACICAALTALAAGLVRVLLHRFLSFKSILPDIVSAVLSTVVLVAVFYGIVLWEIDIGGIAGMFFGWLVSSFVVCGITLIVVSRIYGVRKAHSGQPTTTGYET